MSSPYSMGSLYLWRLPRAMLDGLEAEGRIRNSRSEFEMILDFFIYRCCFPARPTVGG